MTHMFDTNVAEMVGVNAAILFQTIAFWCQHSEANDKNFHDGSYWTYSSVKAFSEVFPYLSTRQISTAIDKLIEAGLVIKGNYNQIAYDRTTWYAVTKNGKSIFQKCKIENAKKGNRKPENVEPIPDSNTDNNKDISNARKRAASELPDGFAEFYAAYPRKVAKPAAVRAWKALKPGAETQAAILGEIERRRGGEWNVKDMQYIPHPATYLNQRRWEDTAAAPEPQTHSPGFKDLSTEEQCELEDRFADEYWAKRGR